MSVKDMTDQQLNRALAELMGYSVKISRNFHYLILKGDSKSGPKWTEDMAWEEAPNYCADPAVSLEVQAAAINKDEEGYIRNWLLNKYGKSVMAYTAVSLGTAAEIANSSPRERAEAAYMTLSSQD
ncbi:hypothetical protein [Paenibacillus sp. 1-18]|uniref:hypothetical protein n=1 Tax=Paenibacillus sp. 1-18 TaxID=1333846 RepID=UPI0004BC5AAC|nr:hypothetical protein [Paenibacillus sp. 1-18]